MGIPLAHVPKGPGHTQRVPVNVVGGADVIVDFTAIPQAVGNIRIVPWTQIDIQPLNTTEAVRVAWVTGEIGLGRYFTIPAGVIMTIVGPGIANKLYLRGDVGAQTVEVTVFE